MWIKKVNKITILLVFSFAAKRHCFFFSGEAEPGAKLTRAQLELQLIRSKSDIENPDVKLKAKVLN